MYWEILVSLLAEPDLKSTPRDQSITVALEQKMWAGLYLHPVLYRHEPHIKIFF